MIKVKDPVMGSHTGGSEHMVKVEQIVGNSDNLRFTKRLYSPFFIFFFSGHKTITFHRLERFYFHALWVGVPCTAF